MFSLRILRPISRKPPCLPRRVGLVGLGVVPVFFSASFFLRAMIEGLLIRLVRRALARVVVADARAEGAARHPHEADVVGRVELARVGAAVEERDRLAEEGHVHVAQGEADGDGPVGVVDDVGHLAVHLEERREHLDGVVGRRARHRPDVEGVGLAEVLDRARHP